MQHSIDIELNNTKAVLETSNVIPTSNVVIKDLIKNPINYVHKLTASIVIYISNIDFKKIFKLYLCPIITWIIVLGLISIFITIVAGGLINRTYIDYVTKYLGSKY